MKESKKRHNSETNKDRELNNVDLNDLLNSLKKDLNSLFQIFFTDEITIGYIDTPNYEIAVENNESIYIKKVEEPIIRDNKNVIPYLDMENDPFIDIHEYDEYITVTVETFGILQNDILIGVLDDKLKIKINDENLFVNEYLSLPCEVIPKSLSKTFHQGILDIILKKK